MNAADSTGKDSPLDALSRDMAEIDKQIVTLLNKRAMCALKTAPQAGVQTPAFPPDREESFLEPLLDQNAGPLTSAHLKTVYREIFSATRALARPVTVAHLGPEGTFSHMAALDFFGSSTELRAMPRFDEIFKAVENRDCDLGVVPLENSLYGTIAQSIDLFAAHETHIQAEWFSRISHSLMSRETDLSAIKNVYSHPQALGQCAAWLCGRLPQAELISVDSTAAAAHRVLGESGAAAVGHGGLAPRLGLATLAENIEDDGDNWTRFVAIGPTPAADKKNADKTSILFTLEDKPGMLAAVLQRFAEAGVNMNKLESRPMRPERWKYMFFCDVACDLGADEHAPILKTLQELCRGLRVLGAYKSGRYTGKGARA